MSSHLEGLPSDVPLHSRWLCCLLLCVLHPLSGPWPAAPQQDLPAGYIALAEACWARQAGRRPSADEVLQQLQHLLAVVEGRP